MTFDDFRRRAAMVREIPLETVLVWRRAERDPRDRSKWWTERGPLSVTGPKFMNWHQGTGGGGAIDLAMHLAGMDWRRAVEWLEGQWGVVPMPQGDVPLRKCDDTPSVIGPGAHGSSRNEPRLPVRDDRRLGGVRRYLTARRGLAGTLLDSLIASGKLYADGRGNAVFLLVMGKPNRPVGAELRGTGDTVWRGMAPGTRKDRGFFWMGPADARRIVLCESAIDAISCCQLDSDRICISTSGARANPGWLSSLIVRGHEIHCGFDADEPGDDAARAMIQMHPSIQRLRPAAHDWNDLLTSRTRPNR